MLVQIDARDRTFTHANRSAAVACNQLAQKMKEIGIVSHSQHALVARIVRQHLLKVGEIGVKPMMTMTLTVDHRAVDGAVGSDFLRTLKQYVEDPALAL